MQMLIEKIIAAAIGIMIGCGAVFAGHALMAKFQVAIEHYAAVARSVMGW